MRLTSIAILLFSCLWLAAGEAKTPAPFELPSGVEVISRDDSGKTWRMNGRLALAPEAARKALAMALTAAKWRMRHETLLDQAGLHRLSLWTRGNESLLLLSWQDGDGTCFSWGTFTE